MREWLPDDPYPRAEVELWPDDVTVRPGDDEELDIALARIERARELRRRVALTRRAHVDEDPTPVELPDDPTARSFALASRCPLGAADRNRILAATGPGDRLAALNEALDDAIAALEFQLL